MSVSSFKSVFMVASCAGAALGCYLVSLRVAAERGALEDVETQIVLAQRDLRLLQTEIGTRGRLAQLERWNANVIALSAPGADQFLAGSFALAKLTAPTDKSVVEAPVVLASASNPPSGSAVGTSDDNVNAPDAAALMHDASLKRIGPDVQDTVRPAKVADTAARPTVKRTLKTADDTKARPKAATVDPLAPVQAAPTGKLAALGKSAPSAKATRDPAAKQ